MPKTNFNHFRSPSPYVIDPAYGEYTTQPESGKDDERVFYSLFLPVKSSVAPSPVTFLILKPKSLWLKKVNIGNTNILDVHSKSNNQIVSYSPSYQTGEEITINFLPYPLDLEKLFAAQGIPGFKPLNPFQSMTVVLAEDANIANRARIAAPNLIGDTSYESFSRWL